MKPAATFAIVLGAILIVLGLADRIDRWGDAQAAARDDYRAWVADACLPQAGERALAIHDGQRITCTIYATAGYGLAEQVRSAATLEPPL